MANGANVAIYGKLIRDPEENDVNGNKILSFTVAVDTMNKNADGKYASNFYDCTWWNINAAKFFRLSAAKGKPVTVFGDFSQREYTKKDGTKGYRLCVNVANAFTPWDPIANTQQGGNSTEEAEYLLG